MRYKVRSSEIAHLWAHQTQDHAESAGAMSFRGSDFYSYSTVIGSVVTDASGNRAYLISEARYSVTTSSHQRQMRLAIPDDAPCFYVPGVGRGCSDLSSSKRIVAEWKREIENKLEEAGRSRQPKKNRLLGEAACTLNYMNEYVKAFAVKGVQFPVIASTLEELAVWLAEKDARDEAAKRRQQARLRREYAADREAWMRGESPRHYNWYAYFPVELRIFDGEVETSKGATFPIEHARKGLKLVEAVKESGREWKTNGHTCHLGHYQIDRIESDGTVHAGCHEVKYSAIERIKAQLVAA